MNTQRRKAVAPVLATLLMIAVAVAMSVIIFMWAQGFLSNSSSAIGSQQGSQNVAAQSSINIEIATFVTGTGSANACGTGVANPCVSVIVRNVGAVSVTIGSFQAQGSSSNAGFGGSVVATSGFASACTNLSKGASCEIDLTGLTSLKSGDVITIKIHSTVGTFASAQYSVP